MQKKRRRRKMTQRERVQRVLNNLYRLIRAAADTDARGPQRLLEKTLTRLVTRSLRRRRATSTVAFRKAQSQIWGRYTKRQKAARVAKIVAGQRRARLARKRILARM